MESRFLPMEEIKKLVMIRGRPVESGNKFTSPNRSSRDGSLSAREGIVDEEEDTPTTTTTAEPISLTKESLFQGFIKLHPYMAEGIYRLLESGVASVDGNKPSQSSGYSGNIYNTNSTVLNVSSSNHSVQLPLSHNSLPNFAHTNTTTAMSSAIEGQPPTAVSALTTFTKNIPHVILSETAQHARLLKLKSEFMSVFLAIPDKLFKWPENNDTSVTSSVDKNKTKDEANITSSESTKADQPDVTISDSKKIVTTTDTTATTLTETVDNSNKMDIEHKEITTTGTVTNMDADVEDNNKEKTIDATTTAVVPTATVTNSDSAAITTTTSNKEEAEDTKTKERNERKHQRRQKRKQYNELIFKKIQSATTPAEVLELVNLVESALPSNGWTDYDYKVKLPALPCSSTNEDNEDNSTARTTQITTSYLGLRIFALDRSIRYEELKGIETSILGQEKNYKAHTQYIPKCCTTVNCIRSLCHDNKCVTIIDNGSRMIEISDNPAAIPTSTTAGITGFNTNNTNPSQAVRLPVTVGTGINMRPGGNMYNTSNLQNMNVGQQQPPRRIVIPNVMEYQALLKKDPNDFDIEGVQPYVPMGSEISSFGWV